VKREYVPLYASISTSAKLADLGSDTRRLFYTWLLAQCDAWGRIEADARVLRAKVWPLLDQDVAATAAALEDCCRVGLTVLHERDGLRWVQVPDWEEKAGKLRRDDRVTKAGSKFPDPAEDSQRPSRGLPDDSGRIPGPVREDSRSTPASRARARPEESRGEPEQSKEEEPPAGAGFPPSPAAPAAARSAGRARGKRPKSDPDPGPASAPIPSALDTPEFRALWAEWIQHREKNDPMTRRAAELTLTKLERMGARAACEAIENSLEHPKWTSIYPPNSAGQGSGARGDDARSRETTLKELGLA